ncbi:MAG: hypothetical protein IJP96_06545 [Synergistaceae bacterium]|nr:hypothetical protein [Synergistaceae bacterium]MBR0316485.1 hypothetical protein [Synergistaceae bacterium]
MNTYLTIFGKPRYLGLLRIKNNNFSLDNSKLLVLKTSRGIEIGLPGGKISDEMNKKLHSHTPRFDDSNEPMLQRVEIIRTATDEDLENYYTTRNEEENALLFVRDTLNNHGLNMKIVDVEFTLDRRKFYCYFYAEQRIDFRMFVRDIARNFHTRIEMRQIGHRDEARVVRGLAGCGRPCCCSYWLHGFMPVSIKMVKEQRSALNPIKISGLCGRLMCCMAYEEKCYSELWEKLPSPGSRIKTEQGFYTLEGIELGRERINIRFPNGRLVPVPISDFENFKETVMKGDEWGEDKEMLEKKKAAAERFALIKERAEQRRLKRSAAAPAPITMIAKQRLEEIQKGKIKPAVSKPKQGNKKHFRKAKTKKNINN